MLPKLPKVEQHMINEHNNSIEDGYLEPAISCKDGRVKCTKCCKDFIHILEGIKHALRWCSEVYWKQKEYED